MTKKSKHKKERAFAWLLTIIAAVIILGAVAVPIVIYKSQIKKFFVDSYNKVVHGTSGNEDQLAEDEVQPETEPESTEDEGTALDETSIEELFQEEEQSEKPEIDDAAVISEDIYARADAIIDNMTLRQKVAQLFFISPEALTGVDAVTVAGQTTESCFEEYPVGGLILESKNIEDPEQIKLMTNTLQGFSQEKIEVSLFIGAFETGKEASAFADKEGFEDLTIPEAFGTLSDLSDTENCFNTANMTGNYLSEYGINLDLAPTVIMKSGAETEEAYSQQAEFVSAYIEGLHSNMILGTPYSFPLVSGDKVADKDWSDLKKTDLTVFERLINDGVKILRIGHVSMPQVTGDEIPASMSGIIITQNLRMDMGYDGIIMTDPMNEKFITEHYTSGEASVEALKAGVDVILLPEDFSSAYEGILEAIEDGALSEQRINESVRRIISTKLWLEKVNEQ